LHTELLIGPPSVTEDITTVTFQGGKYVYRHHGSRAAVNDNVWRTGLLKRKEIHSGAIEIRRETYVWEGLNRISTESYLHPYYDCSEPTLCARDSAIWAPVLTQKAIQQDGTTYTTTYSNFDASFNPQTTTEAGQKTRTTARTHFPRQANQNIVSLVKDEHFTMDGVTKSITRTFDANGNLETINRFGVTDTFTYHKASGIPTGDVQTKTDARGKVWTYLNYKRGIPQQEILPELKENGSGNIQITRSVNDTGTIASETNGRGKTTGYGYDGLNRLTSITTPRADDANVVITWNSTSRTVQRGINYTQRTDFDGFGRPSLIDTAGITQDIAYNVLGHKSFESYLGSTAQVSPIGTRFTTDVIGRVTNVVYEGAPGGTEAIAHLSNNRVQISRSNGETTRVTTYSHRSFGDPDNASERVLTRIEAPEGATTDIGRNLLGQITSVSQGGLTRTYNYYADTNFLLSITNPETGNTIFGRDQIGNMTSRQVGTAPVTVFGYDGVNRLKTIEYPGSAPDAVFTYDDNNNVRTASNGVSQWTYGYNDNDKLASESLVIAGQTFTTSYALNTLDFIDTITYPRGQVVTLISDSLGRPTVVSPYIPNPISYNSTGVPRTFVTANGRQTDMPLNQRKWIEQITVGGGAVSLTYGYDGLANVKSITDAISPQYTRSMTYDGLERLKTVDYSGTALDATYNYSTVGNITSQSIGSFSLGYQYGANNLLASTIGSKLYGFGYDVYGNVTSNGFHTFGYDDASNLRSVSQGGSTIGTYTYDANNKRARVQQGGKDTVAFYAKNGDLLGEYDSDGRYKEYVYLLGKLIAMRGVSPTNTAPTANAGPDQTINEGTTVTLNGSGSSDPNGTIARYVWRQIAGPTVALSNAGAVSPSFTAPRVQSNTTLTFSLKVDDGDYGVAQDDVNVLVINSDPDDDDDMLPDSWELQYFGHMNWGAYDDPDGDGLSNLQEFAEGTNPNVSDPAPDRVTVISAKGAISSNTITWQPVTRAASYNLYWSTSPGVTKYNGTKISGVKSPYGHPNLVNGTRYYYVVTAQNNNGESPESPEVSAKPSIAPLIPIIELILGD
jgi:YD repeat-containing protein